MKLLLPSILGLLVLSQGQPVPGRSSYFAFSGVNKQRCQDWSDSRSNGRPGPLNVALSPYIETWLTGFVNGVAHMDKSFATVSAVDVAALMDHYCADNPSQALVQAAGAVMDRLPKR